jgi:hypothetical protein
VRRIVVFSNARGKRWNSSAGWPKDLDEAATCVVDDEGKVMLQTTVATEPDAIKLALQQYLGRLRRVVCHPHWIERTA